MVKSPAFPVQMILDSKDEVERPVSATGAQPGKPRNSQMHLDGFVASEWLPFIGHIPFIDHNPQH